MNALKHSFHSSSGIHSKEALFEHRGDKEDSVSIPQAEFIRRKAGKIRCLQGVRCKGCGPPKCAGNWGRVGHKSLRYRAI